MRQIIKGTMMGLLLLSAMAAPARAQDDTQTDQRDVGVRDRARPAYDPDGIRLSSFILFPELDLSAGYDDNIFATEDDKVGDTIFDIAPALRLSSDWNNHAFGLHANADFTRYASHSEESTTDFDVGTTGRLDIDHSSNISGAADFLHQTEPRTVTDVSGLGKPLTYYQNIEVLNGLKQFDRLEISANVTRNQFTYQANEDSSGDPISEKGLDMSVWTESARASYAVSPETSFFINGAVNDRSFDLKPPVVPLDRDSNGYEVTLGTKLDITHLIQGEIQAGYFSQSFKSGDQSNVHYPAVHALISWFVTPLTTVTFNADRTVENTDDVASDATIVLGGGVTVDHELLRNLILSAHGAYAHDTYIAIDRDDIVWNAGASATYLATKLFGFKLDYTRTDRTSSGLAQGMGFSDDTVSISLLLHE